MSCVTGVLDRLYTFAVDEQVSPSALCTRQTQMETATGGVKTPNAQIPLDLSCRRPGLRLVGDQVADKSRTRSATFLFVGCPNSIGSILSETRSATFLFVENLPPTFICRKLVSDLSATSRGPGPRLFYL